MAALDDYPGFVDGVRSLARVDLDQYKRVQMERRIRSFARRRGCGDLLHYLGVLRDDAAELDAFLDRMTINVSQLWRNPEQWDHLRDTVLPELARTSAGGRVRAWSAGCSYGAEAYTLAAIAREAGVRITVRGTDIDRRVIERAKAGRFSAEDVRSAPSASLQRFFSGDGDHGVIAGPDLRGDCRFEVGDLLRMRVAPASHDLVLCRNTVIYFTDDVRDALHARLATALRPGGVLIVGNTERIREHRALGLDLVRPFVYRRSDGP